MATEAQKKARQNFVNRFAYGLGRGVARAKAEGQKTEVQSDEKADWSLPRIQAQGLLPREGRRSSPAEVNRVPRWTWRRNLQAEEATTRSRQESRRSGKEVIPLTETPKKKNWFRRDVSPGFQKFVNVTVYGAGRASAQLKQKKSEFKEKHKALNAEIKEFNSKNPEKKKHSKTFGLSNTLWFWLHGFSKGVSIRLEQYKAEKKTIVPTTPEPSTTIPVKQ